MNSPKQEDRDSRRNETLIRAGSSTTTEQTHRSNTEHHSASPAPARFQQFSALFPTFPQLTFPQKFPASSGFHRRVQHVDLAEACDRAAVADGVGLLRFAFAIV